MNTAGVLLAVALSAVGGSAGRMAQAQAPAISRTELVRHDLSIAGRESVQVRVDFAPGAESGRHSHPGEEIAYVLEGSLQYTVDGQAPITLRAGEALFIPANTIHTAKNVSRGRASELATYIVEKGKPLVATP